METHIPPPKAPDDSAFPPIDDSNIKVAVDLLEQDIAKRVAERENLMQAARAHGVDVMPIVLLTAEITTLRSGRASLWAKDKAAVATVLARFGWGQQ